MSQNKRLIAKIVDGENVIMTIDNNMLSCEFGSLDRGSITDVVDWGIYANRGSLSFIDNTGYFQNKNINEMPILGYTVKFYISCKQKETLISTFKIESASRTDETKEVSLQLVGKIIDMQNNNSNKSFFQLVVISAKDLSNALNEIANWDKYFRLNEGDDLKNYQNTIIFCPYVEKGTAWDIFTKICQASMSRIYEDENGDAIISGSFPKRTPIEIKPNNILDITNYSFVRVFNTSIDYSNIEVKTESLLEDFVKTIYINYGEDGLTPLSVSDGEVTFYDSGYVTPSIMCDIKVDGESKHNITKGLFLNGYVQLTETLEEAYQDVGTYNVLKTFSSEPRVKGEFDIKYEDPKSFTIRINGLEIYKYFGDASKKSRRTNQIDLRINTDYAIDHGTETIKNINNTEYPIVSIQSNDLIQSNSYYINDDGSHTNHAEHILQEVSRRYSKGIECFEIDCLFNDYYDENGNKVFDREDLSNHFKKYDVIIPYVKKRGQVVPFRTNADGTPKKFRIIGISYSYDGLLKQKLSVQEERYDVD